MLILAGALVASAAVVYALVRLTSPAQDEGGTEPPPTMGASTTTSGPGPSTPVTSSSRPSPTSDTASGGASQTDETVTLRTTTTTLPGSGVTVPAAWSGSAKVTISVLGECATGAASVYTDVSADLALNLLINEAAEAAGPITEPVAPDELTFSLGVNAGGLPSVTLYSARIDDDGTIMRFWQLDTTPGVDRTEFHGTALPSNSNGTSANILVDAETSLQPCEASDTVALPRAIAAGATIDGWFTQEEAALTVQARTTDGKRQLVVSVHADRKH